MTCGQALGSQSVTFGVLLLAIGIALYAYIPTYVKDTIEKKILLTSPDAGLYSAFVNSSGTVNLYMTYHVFTVTNEAEVMQGAEPKLKELGPYVYEMNKWKPEENITWHPNATISYISRTDYKFRADLSEGNKEEDMLTTVNVGPYAAIKGLEAQLRRAGLKPSPLLMNGFLKNELLRASIVSNTTTIFKNLTVQQLLWGYTDPILAVLDPADATVALQHNATAQVSMKAKSAAYTGGKASKTQPQAPKDHPGTMTQWAGMRNLTFWGSEYANMINGTDGSSFRPNLKKGESLYAFVDTIYRSALLSTDETTTLDGVQLHRYRLDPSNLASEEENPNNAAFGLKLKGLLPYPDTVAAPVYISKPYYLDADKSEVHLKFENEIEGSAARTDAYDTYMDVEPHTGQLFHVHKRIQVSCHLREITYFNGSLLGTPVAMPFTKGINTTYFPIMWADEHMKLPTHLVDDFKKELMLPLTAAKYGGIVLAALGGLLILLGVVCVCKCGGKRHEDYTELGSHIQE